MARFSYHQHTVIDCLREDNPVINKSQVKLSLASVFNKDETIVKIDKIKISLRPIGFNDELEIIRYKPKERQSCYNNFVK